MSNLLTEEEISVIPVRCYSDAERDLFSFSRSELTRYIRAIESAFLAKQREQSEPTRDREADRIRFPDPDFNRWLDEGISDAGHTVWDSIPDVSIAWSAWGARPYYEQKREQSEPVAWYHNDYGVLELSRIRRVGWKPLYSAPQPAPEGMVKLQFIADLLCEWKTGKISGDELADKLFSVFASAPAIAAAEQEAK